MLAWGAVSLRVEELPRHGAEKLLGLEGGTLHLERLRAAVERGDGGAVLQITDEIRKPFSSLGTTGASSCLFDDQIFSLTPASKAELAGQLREPAYADALKWVRSGGWWSCSAYNTPCVCNGQVRLVTLGRQQLGVTADGRHVQGSPVTCNAATFGATSLVDPKAATDQLYCECNTSPTNGVDAFHLEKRLNSKSVLQESWVMLLRLLGRTSLLPLGTGDRTYSGMQNWAARSGVGSRTELNVVLERVWIDKFVREMAAPKIKGPRCLEWGDPAKPGTNFGYAGKIPACTQKYDMQFDGLYWKKNGMMLHGNVVYSDIISLPTVLGDLKMDAIFATQVFEHLAAPDESAQALFKATAPGGVVIYTGPQQAQFHQVPHDYYRYTIEGVKYTLVRAGFCVPNSNFAGGGDFVFDIARDAGLQVQDFPMDEIEGAYQVGYEAVSHSAIGVHCLAFKAPHPACDDPTSGWQWLQSQGIRA